MSIYLSIFTLIMVLVGVYAILTVVLNLRFFKKLGNVEDITDGPLISVVVPARDEEKNIAHLLESITKQSYKNIEILVINDQSSDKTEEIIKSYALKDERVKYFETSKEKKLNSNGKVNALLQVLPNAKGEYILATDADTTHSPDCISHTYAIMKKNSLDIISGFPTEHCPSFMGTINMSAMMLTNIFIPHFLVYRFPIPSACFAIGQFIMMRRDAYEETGGYACIKGTICDDVGIVRLFASKKKKYAFISISDYVQCKMYSDSREAFRGLERSIAGVVPPKVSTMVPIAVIVIALLHIALCPIISLLIVLIFGYSPLIPLLLAAWLLLCLAWYLGCRNANWRKRVSISCSLALFMIAAMYIHASYLKFTGKGFVWKGRIIS